VETAGNTAATPFRQRSRALAYSTTNARLRISASIRAHLHRVATRDADFAAVGSRLVAALGTRSSLTASRWVLTETPMYHRARIHDEIDAPLSNRRQPALGILYTCYRHTGQAYECLGGRSSSPDA